ncbi:MAG: hypothetical protein LUQ07_05395 [Methanospirillum sp.]|nr:hypothetical protein [Methanospirillum sp.]
MEGKKIEKWDLNGCFVRKPFIMGDTSIDHYLAMQDTQIKQEADTKRMYIKNTTWNDQKGNRG